MLYVLAVGGLIELATVAVACYYFYRARADRAERTAADVRAAASADLAERVQANLRAMAADAESRASKDRVEGADAVAAHGGGGFLAASTGGVLPGGTPANPNPPGNLPPAPGADGRVRVAGFGR